MLTYNSKSQVLQYIFILFSGINSKQAPAGDWGASFGKGNPLPGINLNTGHGKPAAKLATINNTGYVSSFMGSGKKQASK